VEEKRKVLEKKEGPGGFWLQHADKRVKMHLEEMKERNEEKMTDLQNLNDE
jgi:hypothetical protein